LRSLEADNGKDEPDAENEENGLDLASLDRASIEKYLIDEYLKFNYDTGAGTTAFPPEFSQGGKPSGSNMITASGERIEDMGGVRLKTRDEYDQRRKVAGRVTAVHKILASAWRINRDGRQRAWLTDEGGYLIPKDGPIAKGMEAALRQLIKQYGDKQLLRLYVERGVYNFYLKVDEAEPLAAVSVSGTETADGGGEGRGGGDRCGNSEVGSPALEQRRSEVGSPALDQERRFPFVRQAREP